MEPIVFHITQRGPFVPFILFFCKNNLGYGAARNRGAMSKVKAPRPLHAEQRLSTSKGDALCCRPLKSLPVQTQMSCIVRKDVWQFRLETNFTFHMQSQQHVWEDQANSAVGSCHVGSVLPTWRRARRSNLWGLS